MDKDTIMQGVAEIFRTVFDDEDLVITRETTSEDIEDWDSLEQINLLVAMEKKFSVKFKLDDVHDLANVGEIIDLIARMTA